MRIAPLVALVASLLAPAAGSAWQLATPIHHDCHERASRAALARAGYVRPPPVPTGNDARLPEALQFDLSQEDPNLYAWSLVVGARFPDELGHSVLAFQELAGVHNAATGQDQHCLRAAGDDGEIGNARALAACRRFIANEYRAALVTLDESGLPDPERRMLLPIHVPSTGTVQYEFSEVYAHAGIALHAIQDSFSHAFRTPDGRRILSIHNWVEQVRCALDLPRDGHGHESVLDACEGGDPSAQARFDAAVEASGDFLVALTEPGDPDTREARLTAFLDKWFTLEPGCHEGEYCGNSTASWLTGDGALRSSARLCDGCATGSGTWVALLAVAAVLLRRRRRLAVAVLAAALLVVPETSRAGDLPAGYTTEVRAGLSLFGPAMAIGVASTWTFPTRVEVGAMLELNPWMNAERQRLGLGATNIGVLCRYMHPLAPGLYLRTGLSGGVSILNQEMLGSDPGTRGFFVDLLAIGLLWQGSEGTAITLDAFEISLPAPQLRGLPIIQPQQRISLGLRF